MTPVRGETMKKTAVLETYDNESAIRQMVKAQQHMRVPSALLPVCPRCGKPMSMNLRSDNTFVENEGWHKAAERYQNFLQTHRGRNLFLEIGVGFNTPGIIKYPFWNMTAENPEATYACINYDETVCPDEIKEQAICLTGDAQDMIASVISRL